MSDEYSRDADGGSTPPPAADPPPLPAPEVPSAPPPSPFVQSPTPVYSPPPADPPPPVPSPPYSHPAPQPPTPEPQAPQPPTPELQAPQPPTPEPQAPQPPTPEPQAPQPPAPPAYTPPVQQPFSYVASAPVVQPVAEASPEHDFMLPPSGSSATTISLTPATLAGWGGAVSGVFLCLGAWSPWMRISGIGQSVSFGGLHSGLGLHGTWVLILGLLILGLSVALAVVPRERQVKQSAAAALAVLGLVSLIVVGQQYVHVSNSASDANAAFGAFQHVVNVHIGVGWGLWQCGLASAGAIAAGVLAFLL